MLGTKDEQLVVAVLCLLLPIDESLQHLIVGVVAVSFGLFSGDLAGQHRLGLLLVEHRWWHAFQYLSQHLSKLWSVHTTHQYSFLA